MQKVLSVSVAAYNVEKFIEQCLDSFIDPAILDRVEVLVTARRKSFPHMKKNIPEHSV